MSKQKQILDYNREAWNSQVAKGNQWTVPVTSKQVADAKKGNWNIVLTPVTPVPLSLIHI